MGRVSFLRMHVWILDLIRRFTQKRLSIWRVKVVTRKHEGLEVGNLNDGSFIEPPPVYTKDKMPVSSHHIPRNEDISHLEHLEGV